VSNLSVSLLLAKYHGRMPVILSKEDEAAWLNPDTTEPAQLLPLLRPYPAERMEEWHVGEEARNPRNDFADLISPIEKDKPTTQGSLL
jgi:putative SOS response-associated peptidase YedK